MQSLCIDQYSNISNFVQFVQFVKNSTLWFMKIGLFNFEFRVDVIK